MRKAIAFAATLAMILSAAGISVGQTKPETFSWGQPVGNLKVGWTSAKTEIHRGDPLTLTACIRRAPDDGPPISVDYMGTLLGLYEVAVSSNGTREEVRMTAEGRDLKNPDRYLGMRGLGLGAGVTKCADILLNKWWDISLPGDYEVSISHVQTDPATRTSFTVLAPNFEFTILPE